MRSYWGEVAATVFFTTEGWTPRGLVTFYTLLVIDLKSRRVHAAGITTKPDAEFVVQAARKLTDMLDAFLLRHRFLTCDPDTKFTAQFKGILRDAGVKVILTPKRVPNGNAFAKRLVLSLKSGCLNRVTELYAPWAPQGGMGSPAWLPRNRRTRRNRVLRVFWRLLELARVWLALR